jgi:hypothetical protein
MKLRIKGNSIRLRLTKSEVIDLGQRKTIMETVNIGDTNFLYAVIPVDRKDLAASFDNGELLIAIPVDFAATWFNSEEVGISFTQKNGNGTELFILLEKDFVCLDRPFEDQSDNFPHPNEIC